MTYEEVVKKTLELLETEVNLEDWTKRYDDYIKKITSKDYKRLSEMIHMSPNLRLYTSISNYTNNKYDLRYKGHSIADLNIDKNSNDVKISLKKSPRKNILFEGINDLPIKFYWHSDEGMKFRKHFKQDIPIETEREHQIESRILTALLKRNTNMKFIKPITLNNSRYQFPTPLQASKMKNDILEYSLANGGGIDILARTGKAPHTRISVIELKDEQNKSELDNESPEKAIKQAITYATFIYELLRHENSKNKDLWYSEFGFSGSIPAKLVINAVICVPNTSKKIYDFEGKRIKIREDRDDFIELHYIYYDYNDLTNPSETSLPTK